MHSDNLGIEKECDWGVPELRPKAVEAAGVEAAPQTQERAPVRIKHVRNAVRFASPKATTAHVRTPTRQRSSSLTCPLHSCL